MTRPLPARNLILSIIESWQSGLMHLTDTQAALCGLAGSNPALYTADAVTAPAASFVHNRTRCARVLWNSIILPLHSGWITGAISYISF